MFFQHWIVLPCGRSPQRGENGVQEVAGSIPVTQTTQKNTDGFYRLYFFIAV